MESKDPIQDWSSLLRRVDVGIVEDEDIAMNQESITDGRHNKIQKVIGIVGLDSSLNISRIFKWSSGIEHPMWQSTYRSEGVSLREMRSPNYDKD